MRNFLLMTLAILFISINTSHARVFKIKAGKHYAVGIHGGLFLSKEMKFTAKFDNSAEYYLGNVNQYDINKLYGFSDCYTSHQKNSARFGWVWNDQNHQLEIWAYSYHNKIREMKFVSNVNLNESYTYKIKVNKYSYDFILNNKTVSFNRSCTSNRAHGYKLYPYFGGDEVAPHEIKIEIK